MGKFNLLGASALRSAAFVGFAVSAAVPAYAQNPADDPQAGAQADQADRGNVDGADGQAIIVTGSRIPRPNLTSTVPITSVTVEELSNTGSVSLGDALAQLPAMSPTFTQANSTRSIGTSGLNLLDLRALGTTRTLVLVNGRRHVTVVPGSSTVDVNTIPTDLVERVDVVTGGNSAIYGSDAVAGVVNFILKRDFEGIRLRGQGGISQEGDRGSYFASLTAGRNFADGRGNIAGAVEWAVGNPLFNIQREDMTGAFGGRPQWQLTDNTVGEPSTGDGVPDTTLLRVKNNAFSEGGAITATCPTVAAAGESPGQFSARRAAACSGLLSVTGQELGRVYLFDPAGSLILNPCLTDLRPVGSGNCVGGLGSSQRLTGQLQPGYDRKTANLLASYEFTPAFRVFLEGKYVNVRSLQEVSPTFFSALSLRRDNPFLTDQARAQLNAFLAPSATTFVVGRNNIDFGGRGEEHERQTYRIVGGIDGTFNDDWRYEITLNYGLYKSFYETNGQTNTVRLGNAIDATRNTGGQIVCRINADASTANDDPSCVPINLFGEGAPSEAALGYVAHVSTRNEKSDQFNAVAFMSGDSSQLFELPGGPIGFAIGAEYRRETDFARYDPLTESGGTSLNAIAPFDPPALEVQEAFGEIRIPLLADLPFANELSIEGAARVSKYNTGNTGTTFAYNLGGIYSPAPGFRLRGTFAQSVRAPTQGNLFAVNTQTFALPADPCSATNIGNNPNRRANCAAAGVPATEVVNGVVVPWTNQISSSISGFNRGNPDLNEEKGKSLTIGAVLQPQALPGFSLSVDYYKIEVSNAIFSLAAQTIINQCYDNPSGIDNPFCAAIFRRPDGTFAGQTGRIVGGSTVAFPAIGPSFFQQPFNYAKLKTSGVDVDAAYRTRLSDGVTLNLRGLVSYLINRDFYTDVRDPTFINTCKNELGCPEWAGQFSSNLDFGAVDFGWQIRFVDKMVILNYETQHSFQGRPPEDPDAYPVKWYPRHFTHSFRMGYDVNRNFRFYTGVDNVFNRLPPKPLLGTGAGEPYDNVGRFFYAGAEVKF